MKNEDFHIVVKYYRKPKNPKKTAQKGYINNSENFYYDESVNITRGLKTKDLNLADLIINLNKKEVIRNSKGQGETFEELLYYFQKNYPDNINPILAYIYPKETTTGETKCD